jgi:uncharacterized repeat protein (TIGR03847 family)
MTYYDDIYPVSRITAGSIGEIGRRVFILQAKVDGEIVSWVIEKDQALALSRSIPRLLEDIREEFPELGEPVMAAHPDLTLSEPLEPEFRVGGIGLGYDRVHDLVVLTLQDVANEEDEAAIEPPADDDTIQVYTTRGQAILLGRQAGDVVAAGRPLCPNCEEPIDDFGHFCLTSFKRRKGGDYLQ